MEGDDGAVHSRPALARPQHRSVQQHLSDQPRFGLGAHAWRLAPGDHEPQTKGERDADEIRPRLQAHGQASHAAQQRVLHRDQAPVRVHHQHELLERQQRLREVLMYNNSNFCNNTNDS